MSLALAQKVKELEATVENLSKTILEGEKARQSILEMVQQDITDLNNKYKMLKVSSAKTK